MKLTTRSRGSQGSALILILIMLGIAAVLLVGAFKKNPQIERDKTTVGILAKAKDGLIGYTVSPTGSSQRPGDLLYPDYFASTESPADYDGTTDSGCMDATKANGLPLISGGATTRQNLRCLGRLPWVDMKISLAYADQNDTAGIMPWYATSANLVDPACLERLNSDIVTLPQPAINTDATHSYAIPVCATAPDLPTQLPHPWLTVRDEKGNVISDRVAAVIIIPGTPLSNQSRPTSPNLAGPAAYLDSITVPAGCSNCVPGTYSNADMDNDFIQQSVPSSTFNDTVLFITIDELMAAVEKRVAAEAGNALKSYYSTCGFYPYPVDFANSSCYTGVCSSDPSKTQGRFPSSTNPSLTLPLWFTENRWDTVIYYAVSNGFKYNGDGTTLLTVDGNASARALFFTPAANIPPINRVATPTILANYLLTTENSDGDTVFIFNNTKEKGYQRTADPSGFSPSTPNPTCTVTSPPDTDLGGAILDALGLSDPPPGGDTGQTSITLPDGTVVTSASLGTGTITVTNSGVGVESAWGPPAVSILESLSFTFPTTRNKLALYVNKLNSSEFALLTFYNGSTPIGTTYIQGCANSGSVFDNISLSGSPAFTSVTIAPLSIGGIYILGIEACAGTDDCSITGTGATTCSWP